ncbi:DUF2513 domain-containing protein [Bacillus haynesii]|uniref:DUF2513 domain-containing protein n=1 Tax=Bacillus haynesii TaxID=1925021 RepID=UPI0022804477|nr:DUF2513 domain-containing protein [Bacillus haynesii]MCY8002820.1 DUF2513 domain-containing protein [Bacillus haynesii]
MKLDHDCVRSLLLELEEKLGLNDVIGNEVIKVSSTAEKFGESQTMYCATKLVEAKLLIGSKTIADMETLLLISSLSFEGHQFLDNIRDDGIWKDTKAKVSQLSSVSLPILSQVAAAFIKSKIGL